MSFETQLGRKGSAVYSFENGLRLKHPSSVTCVFQLINVCSNDGQRMFEAAAVGSLLAGGPIVAILGMVYNVIILGPTGFLGSAVFILFYPAMVS